ncbi:MAG: hypothetical protein ACHP7N_02425 [Caulobacterales bacterium]
MHKLLISAAILGLSIPTIAAATPTGVTGTVTVDGAVAARCQFGAGGAALINIPELSDTTTGELNPSTVNGQSAQLQGWCNGTNSTMTVQADPLLNAGSAPSGFSNHVDFTATATAHPTGGDKSASDTTTVAGAGTPVTVGIFSGNIDVVLSLAASNPAAPAKMLAGAYAGDVLVTLTPGI